MATIRVEVKPEMLQWACERAGDSGAALRERFPQLATWIRGDAKPTLKQLEDFARAARVSLGYLFLPEPPQESLPISDLRTVRGRGVRKASPDLLDVIRLCQQRQEWYREHAEQHGEEPVAFVGAAKITDSAVAVADKMRRVLDLGTDARRTCDTIDDAMRLFIDHTEQAGVLVMVSGVVKNSTNRPLNPDEFRGFAIADQLAPLIFVNGVDSKSAQMFTLAHELAHLWLGQSAVSDADFGGTPDDKTEKWCNQVAAEFLVPLAELKALVDGDPLDDLNHYSRVFRVSRLVILRCLLDGGLIDREQYSERYAILSSQPATKKPSSGGSFYNTLPVRASKRFIRALVVSTLEGKTSYRDAFQLLGISSVKTFRGIGERVGGVQ